MKFSVMGIVNVTPDSFSDGGKFFTAAEAVRRAFNLIKDGADFIDIGGESTRPGCEPLGWEEEWSRIADVIREVVPSAGSVKISVDTYHPETARRAVDAGAKVINTVYDAPVAGMMEILRSNPEVELVVPLRPGDEPLSKWGISEEIFNELKPRLYFDPMIGFGTEREDDVKLLGSIPQIAAFGRVLIGASRKRIVKKLSGERSVGKMLAGNLALVSWCALKGASVFRVHDVRETVQALKVISALNEHD